MIFPLDNKRIRCDGCDTIERERGLLIGGLVEVKATDVVHFFFHCSSYRQVEIIATSSTGGRCVVPVHVLSTCLCTYIIHRNECVRVRQFAQCTIRHAWRLSSFPSSMWMRIR